MRVSVIDPSCFSLPYDHSLCEGLSQEGCQVLFIGSQSPYAQYNFSASYSRWNHFYRRTNRIYKFPSRQGGKYTKGIEHIYDMHRLVYCLRKWKPHIIHFQWLALPPVDRWFLPLLRKIAPLVLTVHDTELFHGSPSSRIQLRGFSKGLRLFDHYIVHTNFSRDSLVTNMGIPSGKISVIPHGVFDYYKAIRKTPRDPNVTRGGGGLQKTVLFFGIIKPYKGLDLLIEAFAQLPERLREDTQVLVAGYPKMPIEPLQELAVQLGVSERIVWDLRFIPEDEVASFFERASVVALPYHRIDQSGILMTALAFGKPIVASRVGGFAEVLQDGVHGYLVEPGNIDGLAAGLQKILSQSGLKQQMGKSVKELAGEELSWDFIAKSTIQVYQSLSER